MERKIGIYIHVPFCVSKCDYCDFYSLSFTESAAEEYVNKIISEINRWGAMLRCPADTLYFGGGTPSLLTAGKIERIILAARENFGLSNAEVTVEVNPKEDLKNWLSKVKKAGVNRVSVGFQSGVDSELKVLSRRHNLSDALRTVEDIKKAGIENFSLDLMLGIPNQTKESLQKTLEIMLAFNPNHISAYLLSVEEGTPFYENREKLNIPSDDKAGELYLETCKILKQNGFHRYEISNFEKGGKISLHNTKYWTGKEYLGLGPAAHSMLSGKRFYYSKSLAEYLEKPTEIFEGEAGDFVEWFMLKMRLSEGFSFDEISQKFENINNLFAAKNKADLFKKGGLLENVNGRYFLTDKGALVSNAVITELLSEFGQKK